MKSILKQKAVIIILALALPGTVVAGESLGTAFSYRGSLVANGMPANGTFDLKFTLFDSLTNGSTVGVPITNSALAINSGIFTVSLDFGSAVFNGEKRWLEIAVRTNGTPDDFETLAPRQELAAEPYAQFATHSGSAALALGLAPGAFASSFALTNPANFFSGNGTGLTNVNAVSLGGLEPENFWLTGGNSGTQAGKSFLGTTDNQALELRVNGQRAFRLEPTGVSPNVIGGWNLNTIGGGVVGASIAGGGSPLAQIVTDPSFGLEQFANQSNEIFANFGTVGGGLGNRIGAQPGAEFANQAATISGGFGNSIGGVGFDPGSTSASTIGGGMHNLIYSSELNGVGDTISGGSSNIIVANTAFATIAGGLGNGLSYSARAAAIGGGQGNGIDGSWYGAIGGGLGNFLGDFSDSSTIGGGANNSIGTDLPMFGSPMGVIAGGSQNTIQDDCPAGVISGGAGNLIEELQEYGTISGGHSNRLAIPQGSYSALLNNVIGGGSSNVIWASDSVIAGGSENRIGSGSTAFDSANSIGGGVGNMINYQNSSSTIGGGVGNFVDASESTISGGTGNLILWTAGARHSIGGGVGNQIYAFLGCNISGGVGNSIGVPFLGGEYSTICGGQSNLSYLGKYSTISGGLSNSASATFATIPGGAQANARSFGQMAYASGQFTAPGDAQSSVFVCRGTTTNASLSELFLDGASARMVVPTNSTWTFEILVTGRAANGNSAAFRFLGAIKNTGGTATLLGTPVKTPLGQDIQSWDASVSAEAGNQNLAVNVTGATGSSIRWVASVRTTEVTY